MLILSWGVHRWPFHKKDSVVWEINCIQKINLHDFGTLKIQSNWFFFKKNVCLDSSPFYSLQTDTKIVCLTAFYQIGSSLQNDIGNLTQLKAIIVIMTNSHVWKLKIKQPALHLWNTSRPRVQLPMAFWRLLPICCQRWNVLRLGY